MVTVALDAMGGDYSPEEIIKGAFDALKKDKDINVILVGKKEVLEGKITEEYKDRCSAVYASEVITNEEAPVAAIRAKKDSSIVVGMNLVKEGKADGFVSAGSTGAVLVGGQLIVGRIKGILRPALAPLIPTEKGVSLLIDCGANVDAKPEWLTQFAKMGAIYMEEMLQIKNPSIGLVNIGAEEEKGNSLVKAAMQILKEDTDYNFIGSVEARDIVEGNCSVVVCDAFVGNVVLKMYEGVGKMLLSEITDTMKHSGPLALLAALMLKKPLKKRLKKFDAKQYGGAPILGLKGLVIKVHGNTDGKEVTTAIKQAKDFAEKKLTKKIAEAIDFKEVEE